MLEHGEQRHRRESLGDHARDQAQEGAGGGLGQGLAGGIVGDDAVARELGADAAGEVAVRRDQRGAGAGVFERLAQQQGDRHRFVLRVRRGEQREAFEAGAPMVRLALRPGVHALGRAEGHAEQLRAAFGRGAVRDELAAGPGADVVLLGRDGLEQPRLGAEGVGGGVLDGVPHLAHGAPVHAVQHHRAARQLRDDLEQRRRGRDGAADADAGGDDPVLRRVAVPRLGLGLERLHAADADIEQALVAQPGVPLRDDAAQEGQRDLPMARMLLRHELREPVEPVVGEQLRRDGGEHAEVTLLQRDLVEQRGERAGEAPGLFRRRRAAMALGQAHHEAGQDGLAAQRLDGRRQVEEHGQGKLVRILGGEAGEGAHTGQQHRPAIGRAQEGLAQRAGGAAGGEEDGRTRQGFRPLSLVQPEHAGGEAVEEGEVRGDVVKAHRLGPRRPCHQNSFRSRPVRSASSAWTRSRGRERWNHTPSCTRP